MSGRCLDCGDNDAANIGLCAGCYGRHQRNGSLGSWSRVADLPTVPALDLSWRVDALCAETDPEEFFPEKGGSTREAKRICRSCTVRAECLDYALVTRQRYGIYGGLSERERRRLLEDDSEEASAA